MRNKNKCEQPESSDDLESIERKNLAFHEKYKLQQQPKVTRESAKIKLNFNKRNTRGQKAKSRFILKMISSSKENESGSLRSLPPDSRSMPSQTAQSNLPEGNNLTNSSIKNNNEFHEGNYHGFQHFDSSGHGRSLFKIQKPNSIYQS